MDDLYLLDPIHSHTHTHTLLKAGVEGTLYEFVGSFDVSAFTCVAVYTLTLTLSLQTTVRPHPLAMCLSVSAVGSR